MRRQRCTGAHVCITFKRGRMPRAWATSVARWLGRVPEWGSCRPLPGGCRVQGGGHAWRQRAAAQHRYAGAPGLAGQSHSCFACQTLVVDPSCNRRFCCLHTVFHLPRRQYTVARRSLQARRLACAPFCAGCRHAGRHPALCRGGAAAAGVGPPRARRHARAATGVCGAVWVGVLRHWRRPGGASGVCSAEQRRARAFSSMPLPGIWDSLAHVGCIAPILMYAPDSVHVCIRKRVRKPLKVLWNG